MRSRKTPLARSPRAKCLGWICAGLTLGSFAILPTATRAAGAPLQTPEIGLMLRGGYTSGEVLQEVETRHVVEALDAASEKKLREAGADQRLIDALKSGQYTLAPTDSATVKLQQQQNAARLQLDREAGADRLLEQARQEAQAAVSRHVANSLRGKLVIWKNGQLQPYDENVLSTKKVFVFYYSASWCAPGNQFTPWLIYFYQRFVVTHPDFEIVYISDDRSAEEMAAYMKASGMPWPALEYAKTAQEPDLTRYQGASIPSMVLVDGTGGVHSYSYDGTTYLGPRHVIGDLAKMSNVEIKGDVPDPAPVSSVPPPASQRVSLSGQPR